MICDYGCGQEANHQFKNGKWCCSENQSSCPVIRKKKSLIRGQNHPWFGRTHTEETKLKMSKVKRKIGYKGKSYKKPLSIKQIQKRYPLFSKIEEMRYNPNKPGEKEIQVHCKNHNCENSKEKDGWFTVTRDFLFLRIYSIEKDYGYGESNFYCCEECKLICPLFNFHYYDTNINSLYTSEEYQTWRQQVLKREDYKCEYCEELATDVHHSRPQKLELGFVLDPDFGVACCESCHYKYGHKTGTECSTGNLANKICS